MHAHYHTSSKLSRTIGPRRALVKSLVDSLILYERITTTQARAKVLVPYFDKLVTRAKRGNLADIRHIVAHTANPVAAQKLTTELVEAWRDRNGGYTRTIKINTRRGDGAPMVVVELILPENFEPKKSESPEKTTEKTSATEPKKTNAKAKTANKPKQKAKS